MEAKPLSRIQSTAGAIPVRNEKGEYRMEKVKVTRYMPGKKPDYAIFEGYSSSEEESDSGADDQEHEEDINDVEEIVTSQEYEGVNDRRLARLRETRHIERSNRFIEEPEVIEEALDVEEQEEEENNIWREKRHLSVDSEEESDNEGLIQDQEAIDRRRELMRERAIQRKEEELMDVVEEDDDQRQIASDSSDYEEYSDSDDEIEGGTRLKPVFVKKSDRVTLKDDRQLEEEQRRIEKEKKIAAEKRKKYSSKVVAETLALELQQQQGVESVDDVINTDDENEEEEYESWKIRELQRIKRDREEMETRQKELEETERLRNMSEDDRLNWIKQNPRVIVNKQEKGTYKFLQKYYHRGVFYLDEEDEVLKRNFAQPTLEDHFDKTVLPKVMQVKDFGRAGRTKYTHLVDQDTTVFDSPWSQTTPINLKIQNQGGGMKDNFERPSAKKRSKQS